MHYILFGSSQGGDTAFGTSPGGSTVFGLPYQRPRGMELQALAMLADICRAYPPTFDDTGAEVKCLRPQAFAVLENLSDLNMYNLGKGSPKYASADYFFSHRFEDAGRDPAHMGFDYPLVAVAYGQVGLSFAERRLEAPYRYNIAVFDQNEPDKKDGLPYCKNRTMEQQSADLQSMLNAVLVELGNWRYCISTVDGSQAFFPATATPTGYRAVHSVLDLMVSRTVRSEYIRNIQDNVSGVFGTLEFVLPYCPERLGFSYSSPESLYNPICRSC